MDIDIMAVKSPPTIQLIVYLVFLDKIKNCQFTNRIFHMLFIKVEVVLLSIAESSVILTVFFNSSMRLHQRKLVSIFIKRHRK